MNEISVGIVNEYMILYWRKDSHVCELKICVGSLFPPAYRNTTSLRNELLLYAYINI